VLSGISGFGFWIWAVIDSATKSDPFYMRYPNG
jgi:hypothetical protein